MNDFDTQKLSARLLVTKLCLQHCPDSRDFLWQSDRREDGDGDTELTGKHDRASRALVWTSDSGQVRNGMVTERPEGGRQI